MPTEIQIIKDLVTTKIQAVGAGLTVDLSGWFRADGFSQIRGSILSDAAGTLRVLGNVLPGTGTDQVLETKVLTAGTPYAFVVDVVTPYMKIEYVDPVAGSNIEADGYGYPVSDLESNRAASNPDVVWVKRGENGAVARGTLTAGAAAVIVIPANADRLSATLRNWHTATIYWNYTLAGATEAAGFPLEPKETYTWKETTEVIYAFAPLAAGDAPYATDQQLK